jgi:hypothetical protein
MATVAVITDTHFGARNDSAQLMNSQQKFYDTIFFPTLQEYGIKTVLHGGDYSEHRKYFNFATAQWVYKNYREPLKRNDISEVAIVGNHDCFFKHTTGTNSIEELYRDDNSIEIVTQPTTTIVHGMELLLLPWICAENKDASLRAIEDSKAALVLGHLELSGFQMFRGVPNFDGLPADLFDKFKLVMSGHYHHKSSKGPIHYLGAPYPMTWMDYHDERGFHLLDTETHALTFIENPYSIFTRIIYNDEGQKHAYIADLCQRIIAPDSPYRDAYVKVVVQKKVQPYWFDLLMDALYGVNALDVQIIDDITVNDDEVTFDDGSVNAAVDTVALMTEYVDSLTINASKPALVTYLRGLYLEAMNVNAAAGMS